MPRQTSNMTQPEPQPTDHSWHHAKLVLTALTIATLLAGILVPCALLIWRASSPTVVMQQGSAGSLHGVTVHAGLLRTTTYLSTSVGSIIVNNAFTGPRETALVIQRTNKTPGLRVCAADQPISCAQLLGTWIGPLQPTPAANRATDFARRGLTTDNLAGWLGIGFAALCVMGLLWIIAYNLCDSAIAGDDESTGIAQR